MEVWSKAVDITIHPNIFGKSGVKKTGLRYFGILLLAFPLCSLIHSFLWTQEVPHIVFSMPPLSSLNFMLIGAILVCDSWNRHNPQTIARLKGLKSLIVSWLILSSLYVMLKNVFGFPNVSGLLRDFALQGFSSEELKLVSSAAALCFAFTGLVFLIDLVPVKIKLLKISFSVVPLLLTGIVLIAYAYHVSAIFELSSFVSMSAATAGLFFLLHLFLIISESTELIPVHIKTGDRPLYVSFLIIFMAFALMGLVSSRSVVFLIGTHRTQSQIQEKIKSLQSVMIELLNIETGGRGFVNTGDVRFLEPYERGLKEYAQYLNAFKKDPTFTPEQQKKIDEVARLAVDKIELVADAIAQKQVLKSRYKINPVTADRGKNTMDEIRALIDELTLDQINFLKKQSAENEFQAGVTLLSLVGGSLFAGILLVICFVFYRRNDLQRIKAEQEVQVLNVSLAHKLRETELLNKELESFSYSVSHDLRAPLRAMAGFGQILIEDLAPRLEPSDADYLNRIVAASEKMSRLIDGLLVLSRLTRTPLKKKNLSLKNIASQLFADFSQTEGKRTTQFRFEDSDIISGDESLVTALMQNLIGNAWKFTSKVSHPLIEVGSIKKNDKLVFYVRDNGAGFDMKYADKLFGTFQRLHFEGEFTGTGIGLATSKRIVLMHGGEIWAEGIEGQGATFYFFFPKAEESSTS